MTRGGRARTGFLGLASALMLVATTAGARGGPWDWLLHHDAPPACSLMAMGAAIDALERDIRAGGTIVLKQPDVWGQDRMTSFRRDFDLRLRGGLDQFHPVLSAQVARSEAASVTNQETMTVGVPRFQGAGASSSNILTPALALSPADLPPLALPSLRAASLGPSPAPAAAAATSTGTAATPAAAATPLAPVPVPGPAPGPDLLLTAPGIEPTVAVDEKKQFLEHSYELLRVNLGDDTADAAGYSLYLFRLPVSIDPAGPTCKGWGGVVTISVRHEFGCAFVSETFRNLVINDLVDLLAPIVIELIRSDGWRPRLFEFESALLRYRMSNFAAPERVEMRNCVRQLKLPLSPMRLWRGYYPIASADLTSVLLVETFYRVAAEVQDRLRTNAPRGSEVRALLRQELEVAYDLMRGHEQRAGPLADIGLIETIVQQIQTREFEGMVGGPPPGPGPHGEPPQEGNRLALTYMALMSRLPGNLSQRALGSLCWAIAVDAGLLNRQIREDMWHLGGAKSFVCPGNLPSLFFYAPIPSPDAESAFQGYVKARWPLIALALDPVTDQQNIADAYDRSRNLQLALTGAFASGKMGAGTLSRALRQVRYDTDSVMLNRTVTAFAHGPDTFGWRFYPRYQAPRDEPTVLHALGNALVGGFDPSKLARLEPGQRELTAVVIVPSFLRNIRIETASNWFKLSDPAAQRLETGRMLEQGRRVVALRQGLGFACDAGQYRVDDFSRIAARIDQLERMLPLQTYLLGLPYDNTLGGFELFTQGAMSLVPELVGYEGVEGIDPARVTDLLLVGKHLSLSGTRVIVSGVTVPDEYIDFISRRALRVRVAMGLSPTAMMPAGDIAVPAHEVYVVTPSGTSNRLVIPCTGTATAATPAPAPNLSSPEDLPPPPPAALPPAIVPEGRGRR